MRMYLNMLGYLELTAVTTSFYRLPSRRNIQLLTGFSGSCQNVKNGRKCKKISLLILVTPFISLIMGINAYSSKNE